MVKASCILHLEVYRSVLGTLFAGHVACGPGYMFLVVLLLQVITSKWYDKPQIDEAVRLTPVPDIRLTAGDSQRLDFYAKDLG